MKALINGIEGDKTSIYDRGLAYGDGLFETILVNRQQMQLLREHINRLIIGCERLNIILDVEKLIREMHRVCGEADSRINWLKVIVTAGDAGPGYGRQRAQGTRIVMAGYREPWPAKRYKDGVDLKICKTSCEDNPALVGIKHLNRLQHVMARNEWESDEYHEGIMLDYRGNVVECTASNICMLRGGSLITPRLDRSGVAGVMRDHLLARASRIGLNVAELRVSIDNLLTADSVFICSSMIGVCSVRSIDHHPVGKPQSHRSAEL